MPPVDLLSLSRGQLADSLREHGFSASHAQRLWRYLYHDLVDNPEAMAELPVALRNWLTSDTRITSCATLQAVADNDDATRKFLWSTVDQQVVETVVMRQRQRATVCISSQVGCAVGCVFCATGQRGWSRDLATGEIVAQARLAERWLRESAGPDRANRLTNVVLMGMGEPLLNYEAVVQAADILQDSAGLAIGSKQLTLSTVGVVPGIIRLANERRRMSLAVSLHSTSQEVRARLVPAARAWPLDALHAACRHYAQSLERSIYFEWTLIAGTNDDPADAAALAAWLANLPAHVNLIPLNPTAGYAGVASDRSRCDAFQAMLRAAGIPSTVRQRRGSVVDAACGQLAGRTQEILI